MQIPWTLLSPMQQFLQIFIPVFKFAPDAEKLAIANQANVANLETPLPKFIGAPILGKNSLFAA